jgi:hypothetical protein
VKGVGLFISLHNPTFAVCGYVWSSDCELNHKVPVICTVFIYRETDLSGVEYLSMFVIADSGFGCLSVSVLFSKMVETL